MGTIRRVGTHFLKTEHDTLHQCVVEIIEDRVVNYYTFKDELPMTEWLGGTIELRCEADGRLTAWMEGKQLKSSEHNN